MEFTLRESVRLHFSLALAFASKSRFLKAHLIIAIAFLAFQTCDRPAQTLLEAQNKARRSPKRSPTKPKTKPDEAQNEARRSPKQSQHVLTPVGQLGVAARRAYRYDPIMTS
jgi:hypothetical protein